MEEEEKEEEEGYRELKRGQGVGGKCGSHRSNVIN